MEQTRETPSAADQIKARMNEAYHLDENISVAENLAAIPYSGTATIRIRQKARALIENVRENRRRFGGLDKFLQEFGLSTKEGIALMCLAEALLRIPDTATADKMIRDKIGGAEWDKHIGKADDLFVNASTWALMLTGKVIADVEEDKSTTVGALAGKMVSKLGEPIVRQAMLHAMKIMGQQFVMGRTITEALQRAEDAEKTGYRHSYDMLGEGARTAEDAERYFKAYSDAIDAIGKASVGKGVLAAPGLSVKLSALHPRYEYAKRDICVPPLSAKILALAQKCKAYDIGLTVDAEEASRLEISMDIIENVFTDPSLKGWDGFGLAIQAYQKRCTRLVDWLAALAEETGQRMMVRLVKGAYWDSEIKYAQVNGLAGYPVYTRKAATDVSYLANAAKMLARRDVFYPMFATHNAYTVAALIELAGEDQTGFEFQRLHGMGEPLYHQLVGFDAGKYPCRVYAPVGSHQDLLPYLVRRLLENGANTNFVNRLQDDRVPIDDMLTDPVDYIGHLRSKPHPKIPLPDDLFAPARKNSPGLEFANGAVSIPFMNDVGIATQKRFAANPMIGGVARDGKTQKIIFDPANNQREVGTVIFAEPGDFALALNAAHTGFPAWKNTPADERAACLDRIADLMEENAPDLTALCIREGGKTFPDSIAEIREAIDFCRYYAAEGRKHFAKPVTLPGPTGESNQLFLEGRGVFVCISPWNFPLAIFMGQIAAALMAGNTVIAKPAEQTSLIAMKAVQLMLQAGVPKDVISLLPADGALAGQYLIPDARVAGVCFTGSTEVAQLINRTIAARPGAIIPLIAETGGQNAMIVDSSALPEQIVDDVITSAFRSAGQRCSALRVLYVQEGIADRVIDMLKGACKELTLGDPFDLATDIGPVIDHEAFDNLSIHAVKMMTEGKLIAEVAAPKGLNGTYFAPKAFEIKSMRQLPREVFGPILHVIRYKAENLDMVIEEINASGYGLTFGVHTRIDHTMRDLCQRVNAGNCYVNRSMIGAVVGVQPFGGQGLSGTGPKAGGPHYLFRFATERAVSVNTTASGGNTTLVSLSEE